MTAELTGEPVTRLEVIRRTLPGVAADVTELVVDNPATFAVIAASSLVATRVAVRIVRPRNLLEALALVLVLELTLPRLALVAVDRGWLPPIRVRDASGRLVPLGELGGDDAPAKF